MSAGFIQAEGKGNRIGGGVVAGTCRSCARKGGGGGGPSGKFEAEHPV